MNGSAGDMWVLQVFDPPQLLDRTNTIYSMTQIRFDCANRTFQGEYIIDYSADGTAGAQGQLGVSPQPVVPASNGETMYDAVCNSVFPVGSQPESDVAVIVRAAQLTLQDARTKAASTTE